MTDAKDGVAGSAGGRQARAERLAEQLRANLLRRKRQARARSGGGEGAGAAHGEAAGEPGPEDRQE